jgi:hypothetical protein
MWTDLLFNVKVKRLNQCFSNYGPRTASGPRGVPLWSYKKDRKKNLNELRSTL